MSGDVGKLKATAAMAVVEALVPGGLEALVPRRAPRVPVPHDIQSWKMERAQQKRKRRAGRLGMKVTP